MAAGVPKATVGLALIIVMRIALGAVVREQTQTRAMFQPILVGAGFGILVHHVVWCTKYVLKSPRT